LAPIKALWSGASIQLEIKRDITARLTWSSACQLALCSNATSGDTPASFASFTIFAGVGMAKPRRHKLTLGCETSKTNESLLSEPSAE
jgi:hypothetical protein